MAVGSPHSQSRRLVLAVAALGLGTTAIVVLFPGAPTGGEAGFLTRRPIGQAVADAGDRPPLISHVSTADLDADGLLDVVVCDIGDKRVTWIRQTAAGVFSEQPLGEPVSAPAHAQAVDLDRDGDVDVVVADLGVLPPSDAKVGAVVVLDNVGEGRFVNRVIVERVARVSDVRAADLDGDGDLDLAVAQFGYLEGETRWLEALGGGRFESHVLQRLSGAINAVPADVDGDGDADIVSLVSQEWEEVYVFENDGRGGFTPRRIWGATNEDFGSSWITVADLDRDGDVDVLYSNGDAFDYGVHLSRPWHGLQWLDNQGGLRFVRHRIADYSGASSPQPVDLDGDGDLDVVVVSAFNTWEDPTAQSLIWLENDGAMRFSRHDVTNTPTHLLTLTTGDFDSDGHPDLVTGGMHIRGPYDRLSRVMLWTNGWPRAAR